MNQLEEEIFRKSFELFDKFYTEFGAEVKEIQEDIVIGRLDEIDNIFQDVVGMITSLIRTLDILKNKEEVNFWEMQMDRIKDFVKLHSYAVDLQQTLRSSGSKGLERFLCYRVSGILKAADFYFNDTDALQDVADWYKYKF